MHVSSNSPPRQYVLGDISDQAAKVPAGVVLSDCQYDVLNKARREDRDVSVGMLSNCFFLRYHELEDSHGFCLLLVLVASFGF